MKQTTARKQTKFQEGFTLIELLVVIGILAILLAITLIAINPARQFGQANDTKRRSAITQVLNAIGAYVADNKGILPTTVSGLTVGNATELNAANFGALCDQLIPNYIPALPRDPSIQNGDDITSADCTAGGWDTGYQITLQEGNRITVTAPLAYITSQDGTQIVSVTR